MLRRSQFLSSRVLLFLGFVEYYRQFSPIFRDQAHLPVHLTKKYVHFVCSPQCQTALEQVKNVLISVLVLDHIPARVIWMYSDLGTGGVLNQ